MPTEPRTEAGKALLARRSLFPDKKWASIALRDADWPNRILAIEQEAQELTHEPSDPTEVERALQEALDNLDEVALMESPKPIEDWTRLPLFVQNFIRKARAALTRRAP